MADLTSMKQIEEHTDALDSLKIAQLCVRAADDKKASNPLILDIASLTSIADYFVICSALSERQVQAIVRNVEDELRKLGIRPLSVEGLDSSNWVLLDLGDVIFHCFTESARDYYDLEGCWIDAQRISNS